MVLGNSVGTALGAVPDGDEEGSRVCNRHAPCQRSYIASLSAAVVTYPLRHDIDSLSHPQYIIVAAELPTVPSQSALQPNIRQGSTVGATEGSIDGPDVGTGDGCVDGLSVGTVDGDRLGNREGDCVGFTVGF